ncbi:MAG: DUF364 domain-containing protein [Desulfobacterales bacterium]|jgi:uncharacterized protein (DUF4213/DUF364 family)
MSIKTSKAMILNDKLFNLFRDKAAKTRVDLLCLGLGYTAVVTTDGGIGIAYTYFEDKKSCMVLNETLDYEGGPADALLEKIKSERTIERSMALALVNALNYQYALQLPEDKKNKILFEKFKITKGTKVAMVGYFGPLVKRFEQREAVLDILDQSRGLGRKGDFYNKLKNWADVLFLTSTSILNNSTEDILAHVHDKVKTLMLGPSTPMVAEAFDHLPVHMLAGTVPLDRENIIKAVRHGMGTPVLHKFSRKSYLTLF